MFNNIPKDQFFKNVLTLISGTLISHVVPLLLYPFYTRLFSPADFGLFALFLSIITWVDVVSTGRYELAIIIPEKDEDAANVIYGGIGVLILIFLFMYIIILSFSDSMCQLLQNRAIKPWLLLVPPAVFVMGISKLFNNWLVRKKSFKAFAANKIYQRIIEGVSTLGFSTARSLNGLIAGDFAGRFSLACISVGQAVRYGFRFRKIQKGAFVQTMKKYKEYPLYNSIPALLNTGCSMLPVFIISSFYGDSATGYYNLSRQLLAIPLTLVAANVSQVLFRQVVEKKNSRKPVFGEIKSLSLNLAALAVLFTATLVFLGPWLFGFIFGKDWGTAGEYTQIMVFTYAFSFVITPISIVLVALEKIKILSIWQTAYFILICSLFLIKDIPIKQFLIIITAIDIGAYSVYLLIIFRAAKKFDSSLILKKNEQ